MLQGIRPSVITVRSIPIDNHHCFIKSMTVVLHVNNFVTHYFYCDNQITRVENVCLIILSVPNAILYYFDGAPFPKQDVYRSYISYIPPIKHQLLIYKKFFLWRTQGIIRNNF